MSVHKVFMCVVFTWTVCSAVLDIDINRSNGHFDVRINGKAWFHSGDIFLTSMGQKQAVSTGSLKLMGMKTEKGDDVLGKWSMEIFSFQPMKGNFTFNALIRTYQDHPTILFGQHFSDQVNGTSVNDADSVMTGFPSITVDANQDVGYLAYGGIMFGDTHKALGRWHKDASNIASGLDSGPLVLFDDSNSAFVMSSFANVMSGSAEYKPNGMNTTVTWGLMGMAEMIPKDFSYWTVWHYSDKGVNMALSGWGELMRKYYNKETHYRDTDFVNNYIGYWTDNGAYYYYITEQGKNYEDTILDVYAYAKQMNIPYRYVQYDSWWYPKGDDGGVTEWVPLKSIFPNGLQYLWEKTGWPVIAHNRWWSSQTKYAKVNGGMYDFIVEKDTSKHAIPVDMMFWNDLLRESKEWGLLTYEQDWLNTEFDGSDATKKDLTLGRKWLIQMGKGAAMNGMTVQYCMSPSRHALQSLEIPAVTQTRVSDDYQPGNDQWKIGISSIFAHQMGVAPFKDNFWTTQNQTGNLYNKWEPYPQLQSVVATLSTGPVGPSDKNNHSDVKLIMKSCNSEGLILKPDRPALALDKQITMRAFNGFMGEVWSTYSKVSDWTFGIILAADFSSKDSMMVTPSDIGLMDKSISYKVFSVYNPSKVMDFSKGLSLAGCTKSMFCLYYTTPVIMIQGKELLLLGELDKWVPMSSRRVRGIQLSEEGAAINLVGGVGEQMMFSYMLDSKMMSVSCTMSQAGSAKLSVKTGTCNAS